MDIMMVNPKENGMEEVGNYQRHEIRKINAQTDEFEIILYLDDHLTEFADELGSVSSVRNDILTTARQIINKQYPFLKVTMVKVILRGLVVSSIQLRTKMSSAKAAEPEVKTIQVVQTNPIYYHVTSGDTLWFIAGNFNTTVDHIKRANSLTSNALQLNQRLIIPKAFHTVETGDYLTVLAKKYGTTVDAIKEVNNLTSDKTHLGRTLIIPVLIGAKVSETSPTAQDM